MANENEKEVFFVIDGEVVFVLITDERLSAVLQSEPVVVEMTPELGNRPRVGDKWDGTKIIRQEH
jgi:hypothetical protein